MKIEYIISGIVGLVTGAFGTLLAPWVNWKIEQRKENRKNKIQLINDLRYYLEKNEPKDVEFLNSPDYIRIRPFLSEEFISELENMDVNVVNSGFRSIYKAKFLQELESIEELWGINLPKKKRNKNKSYEINRGFRVTISTGHAVKPKRQTEK